MRINAATTGHDEMGYTHIFAASTSSAAASPTHTGAATTSGHAATSPSQIDAWTTIDNAAMSHTQVDA
eukprot:4573313-Prymnesium_polylepis.1